MNVLVVDSHGIFRHGLVASLESIEGVDAVNEAGSAQAACEHPALGGADVVLVDPSMAGGSGLVVALSEAAGGRVIVCSEGGEGVARAALAAGAAGFLDKGTLTHGVLQAALAAAAAGVAVVPFEVLCASGGEGATTPSPEGLMRESSPPLSEREQRVLALIAEGHRTREVATQLCYSERTVKNVLHDVATKLNARSRSQAVAHAVRDGLI